MVIRNNHQIASMSFIVLGREQTQGILKTEAQITLTIEDLN